MFGKVLDEQTLTNIQWLTFIAGFVYSAWVCWPALKTVEAGDRKLEAPGTDTLET
ncbi:MAG: hypothetical protein ACFCU8_19630 [Thermosynechococcaceae cyanobacterium]